jgi:hypothetical protein
VARFSEWLDFLYVIQPKLRVCVLPPFVPQTCIEPISLDAFIDSISRDGIARSLISVVRHRALRLTGLKVLLDRPGPDPDRGLERRRSTTCVPVSVAVSWRAGRRAEGHTGCESCSLRQVGDWLTSE